MGQLEWNGEAYIARLREAALRGMDRAAQDGVVAAKAAVWHVDTGRYQNGWQAVPATLNGNTVHAEIINECTAPDGHMYARYPAAGTSRMVGDFAHMAGLDVAITRVVGYVQQEMGE